MAQTADPPKVSHLRVDSTHVGPAISMHVGVVHRLEEDGRAELVDALKLAVEEVARRYGWTPQS